MPNNTEAYCPKCDGYTLHFAEVEGWRCENCDKINPDISLSPYKED